MERVCRTYGARIFERFAQRFRAGASYSTTFLLLFIAVLSFVVAAWPARPQGTHENNPAKTSSESTEQFGLKEPSGAERCAVCHPSEVQGYASSAMAHALRRAGREPDGTVTANGSTITMHSTPEGFFQSWESGGDKSEYRVDYVIGSGEHASGYMVNIGGHLFQSPVAYYKRRQGYDLAPGYENQRDPDFTRPVSQECVLCHSGTALHVSGTLNEYRQPAFPSEGITCERCHGPAEKHLADPRAGTILNPAKMERAARDSVCEQCHLFGVARVPNPGKKIADFLPGQPLEETYTIYRNVMPEGAPAGDFKVISHVEQLARSECARKSEGKLWCATCHNPHEALQQSVEYYRARCLSCHGAQFPAAHPAKDSDCLSCHMPRRDAKDGGHTVFTDHRIQRRPEAPVDLPANSGIAAWREPAADLQKRNLGIAYIDVGMQRHSAAFVIQGYRSLTEVQTQFADDPEFFKWIGQALILGKQTDDARAAFDRALQLEPDSATTQAAAAGTYMQQGDDAQAIAHLERAVTIDPLFLPAASTLIGLYRKDGKDTEAAELSAKINAAMNAGAGGDRAEAAVNLGKKAEEVYKNIEVLKGVPAEQLIPAMEFMTASLGVHCDYCHVEGHFEKDNKKPKQTAREMMKMMSAIDANHFDGMREVTCYSCHRGSAQPVGTPSVGVMPGVDGKSSGLQLNLPTVEQVLERYVSALGGAAAIEKITSRVEKGSVAGSGASVEIFLQAPDKWEMTQSTASGQSVAVFDGKNGWFAVPGQPVHEMHPGDLDAARMDGDLQFALHVRDFFPDLRVEYPEKVDVRTSNVLVGAKDGRLAAKFYFDAVSGLLVRLIRYADSPLGMNPSQVEYADYREVDGVKVPFRVTRMQPGGSVEIVVEEVKQNGEIEAGRFGKPGK